MQTANKKLISFILILIFTLLMFPNYNVNASPPKEIKIGLFYGNKAKDSYNIETPGGISVMLTNDGGTTPIFTDSTITAVTVKKNIYYSALCVDTFKTADEAINKANELRASGFDAYGAFSGNAYTVQIGLYTTIEEAQAFASSIGAEVVSPTQTGILIFTDSIAKFAVCYPASFLEIGALGGNISLNSVPYRGVMRFVRDSGNDMAAINVLPLEEYLYSVVPKEVVASWHEEALKAQAVAARTYTITNLNKFSQYGFNLDDTVASQVYGGMNAEHPRTTAAVDATNGEIVLYDGKPASIYYHSSSGGRTANSEDVWSAALPYLRSVEDPYENPDEATNGKWSVTYTKDELKNVLSQKGIDIGDIVDVTAEYSDGRAVKLTFYGTNGSKTYTKDNIRASIGLKSTNFELIKNANNNASHLLANAFKNNENNIVMNNLGMLTSAISKKLLPANNSQSVLADSFTFTGGGWGHGIGMSQWGAKGMADNGFTYKDILTHYFTGVQVETY